MAAAAVVVVAMLFCWPTPPKAFALVELDAALEVLLVDDEEGELAFVEVVDAVALVTVVIEVLLLLLTLLDVEVVAELEVVLATLF